MHNLVLKDIQELAAMALKDVEAFKLGAKMMVFSHIWYQLIFDNF